ncbi:MAG: hypothetical protein ABII06_20600 [Pseudomonadota bacterium]
MKEIGHRNKKISDSEEQKIIVVQKFTAVPAHDENPAGDDDAEYFRQAVEKEVIDPGDKIKPKEQEYGKTILNGPVYHELIFPAGEGGL